MAGPQVLTPTTLLLVVLASYASAELIELSYKFNLNAPTYPISTPFSLKVHFKEYIAEGVWLEMNDFCSSEHSGTHVDAPAHFFKGSWFVDEIPLDRLWNVPGVVVDVSSAVARSSTRNYAIRVRDLQEWEEENGAIPDGAVVVFRTGWGRKVNDSRAYAGFDEGGDGGGDGTTNFPGLSEEAAIWLVNYGRRRGYLKGVVGVGVDTFSIDVGSSTLFPAHVALYRRNVYGIENMANVELLPTRNFTLTILPMRIAKGSGAPSRIIASL